MEFSEFLSPKQLTTLDNKILREKAATLANMYRDDLDKDELSVEIESFKYSVIDYTWFLMKPSLSNFLHNEAETSVTVLTDLSAASVRHGRCSKDSSSRMLFDSKQSDVFVRYGF
ncbi:hypothetical protein AVEN_166192-1 [Araneus ventricosus]|uniref:Uncharacterized protein n=1 Tax=Araneus ventricosus TaxID=182803 RepID=A0A4Y2DEN7_ARAVE|nr:hypothetical protein AVEN_166192-1 [Araneus ventricosus]